MSELGDHFKIDYAKAKSKPEAVFKGEKYRITILSDVLIRLEYSKDGVFNDYPTVMAINRDFEVPKFEVKQDKKYLQINNEYFQLEYTKEMPFDSGKIMPGANLKVTLVGTEKMWFYKHPEARNFKGTAYSLDDTHGKAALYNGLYSTDGFSTIDDSASLVFTQSGSVGKRPNESIDIYLFMYRKDFGKCLQSYFELTGYPALPPRYAFGIWWNKNEKYKFSEIDNIIKKFRKNDMPFSVLCLAEGWHKQNINASKKKLKSGYTFDSELYPEPEAFTEYLHENNIFLGVNIDPTDGIPASDPVYPKMKEKLNFKENISIPFNAYDKNFLRAFLDEVINPLDKIGVDMFWLDLKNKNDLNTLFLLNYAVFNEYKNNSKRRGLILSRNPLIAAHRYPVHYSGNTYIDWKVLKLLPHFNSTSANAGVSYWSHDIGGYKGGEEDAELYIRYIQLGTYSPIFRLSSESGRYYKREPWKWDFKTARIAKDYMRIRHRLIPYIYSEAYTYSKLGTPLIRHLYFDNPELIDEPLYKNEYYFGSEFLISPITEQKDKVMNRVIHRMFVPEGNWFDFKTGKKFPGNRRYIAFYKDEDYPVLVKEGAIIPMAVIENDNLNDTTPPKKLEIQIFPGKSNNYNLYEDDGISSLYKEGYYIVTNIDFNYSEDKYSIIIRPVEGKSNIIPSKRDYKIRLRNTNFAENVVVRSINKVMEHKAYISDNDFIIEIENASTTTQLTITISGKNLNIEATRFVNEEIDEIISDLQIPTAHKLQIADIIFSEEEIKKKRINVRRMKRKGIDPLFIKMFLKLLEYMAEL